jgi:hypothetical protein
VKKLRKPRGVGLIFCGCRKGGWPLFLRQYGGDTFHEAVGYVYLWRVRGEVKWDKNAQTLTGRCEQCREPFLLRVDAPVLGYLSDYEGWDALDGAIRKSNVTVLTPEGRTYPAWCDSPPSSLQEEAAPVS